MDISLYFDPIELPGLKGEGSGLAHRMGSLIQCFTEKDKFPGLSGTDLAIIGVKEDRHCVSNAGCEHAPDYVRFELYKLFKGDYKPRIIDLGNLKRGHSVEDTYFALAGVVAELIQNRIIPIIIGGSQDLTYANYRAYESLGLVINILAVDPMFDLGNTGQPINSRTYLNEIILHQPNFLFNYTNIGYQSYYVDNESVKLMKNLYFDTYRLGKIRENIEEVEPLTRNADMVSVDIAAVRHADAPGNKNAGPNGFYGEEICRIIRYSGLSDRVSSIGFYEINPEADINHQTSRLTAQMIWYFIEGFYNRLNDRPHINNKDYIKYTVSIRDHDDQLVFYKSKKSDQWWMDVPVKKFNPHVYERHHLIPCSYTDYETACSNDIPDRWWQAYQKLM
jgi:formiminoglutamase